MKFLRFIAIIVLAVSCTYIHGQSLALQNEGTLITAFDTNQGKLLCADKRVWNNVQGASDQAAKVIPLRLNAVYALSGMSSVSQLVDGKLIEKFSFNRIIEDFFEEPAGKPINHESVENFRSSLAQILRSAIQHDHLGLRATPGSIDNIASEIFLAYSSNGIISAETLKIATDGSVTWEPVSSHVYVSGETQVTFYILRRPEYPDTKHYFTDLFGNARFARVWLQGTPRFPEAPSIEDALYAAHFLIHATAERSHFVTQGPELVSFNCDCGILRPNGFQWLEENFNTK